MVASPRQHSLFETLRRLAATLPPGPRKLGPRKRLAVGALLLASLLECCSCNPVLTCDQLRHATLASVARNALLEQCQPCLTAAEFAALASAIQESAVKEPGDKKSADKDKTIQPSIGSPLDQPAGTGESFPQALQNDGAPFFYDPQPVPSSDAAESAGPPGPSAATLLPADRGLLQWPIPESVFFLYKSVPGATRQRIATATAFVVSVPGDAHRPLTRFLVTVRHVVDPEWAHCAGPNPESIQIRLNKWSGGVGYENIPLQANHAPRFFTADNASDLAVLQLDQQLIPALDQYKFIDIPFAMLPASGDLGSVQLAQQIVTAGLESRDVQEPFFYPELHSGVLAATPPGPIAIRCGTGSVPRSLHLWFISATGPPGASGAPVYTFTSRATASGSRADALFDRNQPGQAPETPVLLGIQSVAWPDRGLAGITPSTVLTELIQSALRQNARHTRIPAREDARLVPNLPAEAPAPGVQIPGIRSPDARIPGSPAPRTPVTGTAVPGTRIAASFRPAAILKP
jgi:hypothetical protein